MRTVQFEGKDCKGKVESFTQNKVGDWLILTAPDGTEIRVKFEVTELIRIVDEYYANGEPAYLISYGFQQTICGTETSQRPPSITDKKKIQ